MKRLFLTLLVAGMATLAYGQMPQGIQYQAVARNAGGSLLINQNISVRISIIDSSAGGATRYVETFKTGTNQYGLFTLKIGSGMPAFGDFTTIPWYSGEKWVMVEMDASGGSNYTEVGLAELLSVPYALYSGNAGPAMNDTSSMNEVITNVTFDPINDVLTITEAGVDYTATINYRADDLSDNILNDLQDVNVAPAAGQILKWNGTQWVAADDDVNNQNLAIINNQLTITDGNSVDLSPYLDNTDSQQLGFDPATNTLTLTNGGSVDLTDLAQDGYNTSFTYDNATHDLTISDLGGPKTVNISDLLNDADADPTNEQNISFTYDQATHVLTITDAGGSKDVDLTTLLNDPDSDPTNEYNTAVTFDQTTNELTVTDGGGPKVTDLSWLKDDADADPTNEYNTTVSFDPATKELTVTDGGGPKVADLSGLQDADGDPTNELNTTFVFDAATNDLTVTDAGGSKTVNLSSVATGGYNTAFSFDPATNNISITDNGATFTVNLDDVAADGYNTGLSFDPATNVLTVTDRGTSYNVNLSGLQQTLASTVSGTNVTVSISNGNSTTFSIADNDNDALNELNSSVTYDQATNILTVTDAGGPKTVNLTGVVANAYNTGMTFNTTTNVLTITDGGTSFNVDLTTLLNDADANPTNEIQDLSLTGNTLALSSDPTTVNLAPYLDNTDNQTLGLASNVLSITNGNTVSLAPYLDNTDNQTLTLTGNNLSITNGNSVSLATFTNTDNQTLSVSTTGSTVSVGISNGNTISFNNNDADASPTNEIQTLSLSGSNLTISGTGGNTVTLPADLWTLTGTGTDIKRSTGNVFVGNTNTTNTDLTLSGRLVDWDNTGYNMDLDGVSRLNDVVANYVDFSSGVAIPNRDGVLYRYNGQAEIMVDDNLYIRDAGNNGVNIAFESSNGWVDARRFRDMDNTGYYADPNATSRLNNFLADNGTTYGQTFLNYNGSNTLVAWNAGAPTYSVCNSCCNFNLTNWSCGTFSRQFNNDCGECGQTTYHYLRMEINGGGRATAWFTTSDEKYKQNIKTIPNALEMITKLRGTTYDYNWDGKTAPVEYADPNMMRGAIGFIAQELQQVMPQAVQAVMDKDAEGKELGTSTLAVQYDAVIPVLVEAIKEQQKQIDELKKQLATQPK